MSPSWVLGVDCFLGGFTSALGYRLEVLAHLVLSDSTSLHSLGSFGMTNSLGGPFSFRNVNFGDGKMDWRNLEPVDCKLRKLLSSCDVKSTMPRD